MSDLNKKLSELQAEIKVAKSLKNNFGNYNYRNVEQILSELKPYLVKLGLSLILSDEVVFIGNRFYIKATAKLSDGVNSVETTAYARESESKKGMDEAQLSGSCSSYARKYALGGLLLLDDNKDIDSLDNSHNGNERAKVVNVKAQPVDLQLKKLKEQVFAELQAGGIDREDMMPFFTFAGIDKDSKKDLQDFLNCDMQSLISSFFDSKNNNI